ncbi:MAG: glycosyltransferase family 2 protein, partial [Candidatus Omnitrophica bacterium]|nr:glycosyltransferase family 2 protein [Candidatus Omnitrophota bacterium]
MSFPKLEVATPDLETNKSKPYSETLRIVVVIPTSKRPASFEQMLRHLAQNEFPSNLDHIIVVENGPQLGVEKILLRYPHLPLMYLHEPKANKSLALNRALDALDGNPLIVFFDDDVVVHSTCVQAYQDAALQLPERAYLGGPTTAIYEKAPPTWLVNYFFPSEKGLLYEGPLGWTRPNLFFIGFNWACYKDLLIEAGGFDPRFGPGSPSVASGQESQMQRCLQSIHVQGYYVPEATVSHHVTSKTGSPSWILFRLFKS